MKDKSKRNIVFYGAKFGLEFSGGCIATCRIFEQIQHHFEIVIVISNELGTHHINNLKHISCASIEAAVPIIQSLEPDNTVFYGDFYDAIAFVKAKVPFYFTYHDNWPEQRLLNAEEEGKADYFISIYKQIFEAAIEVFTVSEYKSTFIRQFTSKISLVRNGLNHPIQIENYRAFSKEQGKLKVLMTGNVDRRKYEKAIALFDELSKIDVSLEIDIYGWQHDKEISNLLGQHKFVQLKGYQPSIEFEDYHVYLSTSFIENLSISVVEALKNYLPVVCFDVGGLGEVVNEKNGALIPAFHIGEMAKAIHDIYQGHISFEFNQTDLSDFDWKVAGERFISRVNSE